MTIPIRNLRKNERPSRLYHQIVKYLRFTDANGRKSLIPVRTSWFWDGVKFSAVTKKLDFQFLYSGHAQWVAGLINNRPMRRSVAEDKAA